MKSKVDSNGRGLAKHKTGIPGFDAIASGGLPWGRTTLIAGTAGSAKTVFACQFLAEGILQFGEPGVFVTFEEFPEDIRQNLRGFGWDVAQWEAEGKWAFVDAAYEASMDLVEAGEYDFSGLVARIEHAVKRIGANRVSLDSLGAVFTHYADASVVRREIFRVAAALKALGVTAVITAERESEYGPISRYGVEEFVADNAVILRHVLEFEKRRRTVEILKFRGTTHQKGEYPFTISPKSGITVIPISDGKMRSTSSDARVSSGVPELDRMCGGGYFRDSIILASGATGAGKTLLCTSFLAEGARRGERVLLLAYEESRDQLFRNARGWGYDFFSYEQQNLLKVVAQYPEGNSIEDHLINIKNEIEAYRPQRIAVDSLTALERITTAKGFQEFLIGLTAFVKDQEVPGFLTATTSTLLGSAAVTDLQVSTITDTILLLRYVELFGELKRGLTVLKMRGSAHESDIREYTIDGKGMHLGAVFRSVTGIVSGNVSILQSHDIL